MSSPLGLSSADVSGVEALGFRLSEDADIDTMRILFRRCFGEEPDPERLALANRLGILTAGGDLVAGAVVELLPGNTAYFWLLAVREQDRGRGVGRQLFSAVVHWSRARGCKAIRLKTYRRWRGIRPLLIRGGWAMTAAELSDRNDRVGEVWQKPLTFERIPVVVIGGNPQGRGGEWANNILSAHELWDLRAIVDPDPAVRAHWEGRGGETFPDIHALPNPEKISAAVIAVPPSLSAPIQKACFGYGWAVLVEKPLAASLSELVALQGELSVRQARFVPGVQRRSHPSYVALKALLHGVEIRKLSIRIALGKPPGGSLGGHRADSRLCRGGALIDIGYHALDLAHFLIGESLEIVSCSLLDQGDIARGIESAADVLCRAGRTWVRIQVDRHGESKREEIIADTSSGMWTAGREKVVAPDNSVAYECAGSWSLAENGRLAELAIACSGRNPSPPDLWEHISAFGIIERAYGLADQLGVKGT